MPPPIQTLIIIYYILLELLYRNVFLVFLYWPCLSSDLCNSTSYPASLPYNAQLKGTYVPAYILLHRFLLHNKDCYYRQYGWVQQAYYILNNEIGKTESLYKTFSNHFTLFAVAVIHFSISYFSKCLTINVCTSVESPLMLEIEISRSFSKDMEESTKL